MNFEARSSLLTRFFTNYANLCVYVHIWCTSISVMRNLIPKNELQVFAYNFTVALE